MPEYSTLMPSALTERIKEIENIKPLGSILEPVGASITAPWNADGAQRFNVAPFSALVPTLEPFLTLVLLEQTFICSGS
jgi:hypothetical protein